MDEDVHDWMSAMHWICQNGLVRGAWMAVANGLACVWLSAPAAQFIPTQKCQTVGIPTLSKNTDWQHSTLTTHHPLI